MKCRGAEPARKIVPNQSNKQAPQHAALVIQANSRNAKNQAAEHGHNTTTVLTNIKTLGSV